MEDHISPVTAKDEALFSRFLEKPLNFEDSFHYLQIYFQSGGQELFKYHKNDALIFFSQDRRGHIKLFKPLGQDGEEVFPTLLHQLSNKSPHPLDLRFLTPAGIRALSGRGVELGKPQRFEYLLYALGPMKDSSPPPGFRKLEGAVSGNLLSLRGRQFRTLRQKCSRFARLHDEDVRLEQLSPENLKDAIHFLARWKGQAQVRGFSYIDIEKNKQALRYLVDKLDNRDVWCLLYYLGGKLEGVQAAYRINQSMAAHIIGCVNISHPGLSEWSQLHIWKEMAEVGIEYVNDGASWSAGLRAYKMKFRPAFVREGYRVLCKG